jgi:RNA polymerase sigma factor (sigma-70 family)
MKPRAELNELARQFEAARRHLRSVALHLLGSVADAEDAVQSAWLKASHAQFADIENRTAWFTTITIHESVDQLRRRRRQFEQPLSSSGELDNVTSAGADEQTLLADSVSRALLVVVDRLSPAQRVAFVLHDVFAVPFETIAEVLGRSPDAAKKLASRARARVHPGLATRSPRTAEHIELVQAFLTASRGGDIRRLLELLAPDVVRRVDAALVPADVPTELRGALRVAEETRRFTHRARNGVVVLIDGIPGIVIAPSGRAETLLQISFDHDNRICAIDITGEADRVRRVVLAMPY